jgi:hypothetical protein
MDIEHLAVQFMAKVRRKSHLVVSSLIGHGKYDVFFKNCRIIPAKGVRLSELICTFAMSII